MTTTFALITEGITDQVVLKAILEGHYRTSGADVDVVNYQPARDETDASRQGEQAGWERVLDACSNPDVIRKALAFNDYLIVQIDTDVGEEVNFGITLTENGQSLAVESVLASTIAVIQNRFGALWHEYADKIRFAICVHSLECWLLVEHGQAGKNSATLNCANRLERELKRANRVLSKDYRCYTDLATPLRKPRTLTKIAETDISFRAFINGLPQLPA